MPPSPANIAIAVKTDAAFFKIFMITTLSFLQNVRLCPEILLHFHYSTIPPLSTYYRKIRYNIQMHTGAFVQAVSAVFCGFFRASPIDFSSIIWYKAAVPPSVFAPMTAS